MGDTEQWIRLTDGCFRDCWNCYAPKRIRVYDLPKIVRNKVIFLDMNFLHAHPDPNRILEILSKIRVNGKVVYYDFMSGLDYTLIDQETADLCKKARIGHFNNKRKYSYGLRIAWDRGITEQYEIKKCFKILLKAGYNLNFCHAYILGNGLIPFSECKKKMQILLRWGVGVRDMYFDNQLRGKVKPIHWKKHELKEFGKLSRGHNHLILYGIYPQIKKGST